MGTVLPIVIASLIIVAIIVYGIWLSRRMNNTRTSIRKSEVQTRRGNIKYSYDWKYIDPKVVPFFNTLKSAMPSNYVIVPNVPLELLYKPSKRADLQLQGVYTDFCIFTQTYTLVLIITLIDYSPTGEIIHTISAEIKDFLRQQGISVMDYAIRDNYSVDDLRKNIAKAMNPLYSER